MKISIKKHEARTKAFAGTEYVGDAILSTIGPYGLNFLLEKGRKITNDGYTISAELVNAIDDEYERLAAQVAHEACDKTNSMVGDATSTAWGLTYNIIKEAKRYLPDEKRLVAKKSPAELGRMIRASKERVIAELEKAKTPVTSKEELIKSALVSVEDEDLAKLLGEMQWELGPNGRIIAEETNDPFCSIEKAEGLVLDNGFVSSDLINDPEKNSLELGNLPIILTNYTIGVEELTLIKENIIKHLVAQKKAGLIIIGRAFTPDAIKLSRETMAQFPIVLINAPYVDQREVMRDMEAVVGGRYIDNEESSLSDIYISDVGFARKIIARQTNSVLAGVDDEKAQTRIAKRVERLEKKLAGSQSDFEKRMLSERIAQLTGGFAILKIGSRSVNNRKRLKDKADDGVHSVRLALQGGTVKGGGLAFTEISDQMDEDDILKRPIRCVYDTIITSAPEGFEVEDWVRDPFITLKTALENACEFCISFITLNGIITTRDKHKIKNETE